MNMAWKRSRFYDFAEASSDFDDCQIPQSHRVSLIFSMSTSSAKTVRKKPPPLCKPHVVCKK